MLRRAFLYLRRKNKRSILLLLLLFVISFSLSVGICVWRSISTVTHEIQHTLGASINFKLSRSVTQDPSNGTVVTAEEGSTHSIYNGPKLNEEIVNQILDQVDGISDYNIDRAEFLYVDDVSLVSGLFESVKTLEEEGSFDQQISELYTQIVTAYGVEDTSLDSHFRTGAFELVEGRHLTHGDKQKALISDEVARLNDLKVGDTINLSCRAGEINVAPPLDIMGETKDVEIVGIFHVNGYQPTGKWVAELAITYNYIFADLTTVMTIGTSSQQEIFDTEEFEARFDNITLFVEDPSELDYVLEQLKHLDCIDTQYYDISIDDTMYKSTVDYLNSIRNLVVGGVAVIVAGCVVVLLIVFTMWVKSRKKEIAIYLSLGLNKASILGQLILEAALIAVIAGSLSFAASQKVPDAIGNQLLATTIAEAEPQAKEYTQEELHQAAMSGTMDELYHYESSDYVGPDNIDFSFRFTDLIVLLLLEFVIIIGAICKGGSFIFQLEPRQIMSELR